MKLHYEIIRNIILPTRDFRINFIQSIELLRGTIIIHRYLRNFDVETCYYFCTIMSMPLLRHNSEFINKLRLPTSLFVIRQHRH